MISRLLRWLQSDLDRRFSTRESGEGLIAFYWDGDKPKGHRVRDISRYGAYVEAGPVTWGCGTAMILTLQIESDSGFVSCPPDTVAVQAVVVRTCPTGLGVRFLYSSLTER